MATRKTNYDPISPWFMAAEDLGEYIGIRFGHIRPGATEPEWIFLRHADYDGIGGLADLLRRNGAKIDALPQLQHPAVPSRFDALRLLPKYLQPRSRVHWNSRGIPQPANAQSPPRPPTAVAWHVFDEAETLQIKQASQKAGVTVNSFLVDHLTRGIRPFLKDTSAVVPWMIPVNLRGKVQRDRDTANFTSYVAIKVKPGETVREIHRDIFSALDRKDHWANWQGYELGKFTSHGMRKFLLAKELAMSQWNLGSFSNLGNWDPDKQITADACLGSWLFCPPVLRCQEVGAGCITFQNKLSLTIQAHPELTAESSVCRDWMQSWARQIKMDLGGQPSLAAGDSDKGLMLKLESNG